MKKLFLGICYVFFTHILIAQTISGTVKDALTGEPIASASLTLQNAGSTISMTDGSFIFKKVRGKNLQLEVSHVGYTAASLVVTPGNSDLTVLLQPSPIFMTAVEVSAIRAGRQSPFSKTDLKAAAIEKENLGQDLPFLLNALPSVLVNSDAGNGIGYTGIRIRGTDASRINVTLNGIPYNDAESQGTFFVDLPDVASSLSSIQVQRGVGTSSNGSGAFGGTINLSTNEVHTQSYGEINNSFGSFNSWKHTVKAGTGLIDDHFTLDARISQVSSDGFIDRASSKLQSLYLSGAYLTASSSIRFNLISGNEKTYQAWNGIPEAKLKNDQQALLDRYYNNLGYLYFTPQDSANLFGANPRHYNYFTYPNQTDNYKQDHYQLFLNHSFNSHWQGNTAFFLTRGKGYYEEYKYSQAYADYGLPDYQQGSVSLETTDLVRRLWLDNYFYGQIFSLQYQESANKLQLGGGWNKYDGSHYGNIIWASAGIPKDYEWYHLKAHKTDLNIYGKYERRMGQHFRALADLQFRNVVYDIGGFRDNPSLMINNNYQFFNPKVGLSYSRGAYYAYASYAIGQKEPNRDDYEAGKDQQPVPEKLQDLEAGVQYSNNVYSWGLTGYYMRYKNQLVLTGKINDVGAYTRSNIPNSFRLGLEMEANARLLPWMQLGGNLTVSRNRVLNFTEYLDDYDMGGQKSIAHGNTDIALSPGLTGAANLVLLPLSDLQIMLQGKYAGRQYLDNSSDVSRSLDPYYVQDLRIAYTLHPKIISKVDIILQLNNIFNRQYTANGYTYSYYAGGNTITENFYYPMAGTNFMLALNISL